MLLELHLLFLVLLLDELILFAVVRQDDHIRDNFGPEFGQLVISLFNFFVQRLVFDLQLFKIDQMEPIGELLLFAENLLLVLEPVAQRDVLKTVLVHLLVLSSISILPLLDLFL